MRQVRSIVAVLLFGWGIFVGAAQDRPTGRNCGLAHPPTTAGEEYWHGVTLRIHPRANRIDRSYSGCQTVFLPSANGWQVVSITEVLRGDPVRIWTSVPSEFALNECRYKGGRLTHGDADRCPVPQSLLMKSMNAGCIKAMRSRAEKSGLDPKWPQHCEYE